MRVRSVLLALVATVLAVAGGPGVPADAGDSTRITVSLALSRDQIDQEHHVVDATVGASRPGDYQLTWEVQYTDGSRPLHIHGGKEQVSIGDDAPATVRLDLSHVPSGQWRIVVILSGDDPEIGEVYGSSDPQEGAIDVRWPNTGGTVTLSSSRLDPVDDGYRDAVTITVRSEMAKTGQVDVLDSDGKSVWHGSMKFGSSGGSPSVEWDGRRSSGGIVPVGSYHPRVVLEDDMGETKVLRGGTIHVSHRRLVTDTFKRTVSASGSMVDRAVGGCSRLTTPSSHGWAGSIGLQSNISCRRGARAGTALAVHRLRLPAASSYGDLTIVTTGGAAATAPGSKAHIDFHNYRGYWGDIDPTLGSAVGGHSFRLKGAARWLDDHHRFMWATYAVGGARYDVRSFTITVTYRHLG